jgi:sialic acid synthase SpsE
VENIRVAEKALGKARYGLTDDERNNLIFRRSLFVVKDIRQGESFTTENIRSIRPSNGIKPKYLTAILGKRARKDIKRGTPLDHKLIRLS